MLPIKIGQLNCQGSKAVMSEILKVANELQLDILCLQEPYTKERKVLGLPRTARAITYGDRPKAATIALA